MNSRFKALIRVVAAVTCFTFIAQDFSWAAGSKPVWTNASEEGSRPSPLSKTFTIPYDAGVTRSVKPASGEETVINIQDAHASIGAQKSIASILGSLAKD